MCSHPIRLRSSQSNHWECQNPHTNITFVSHTNSLQTTFNFILPSTPWSPKFSFLQVIRLKPWNEFLTTCISIPAHYPSLCPSVLHSTWISPSPQNKTTTQHQTYNSCLSLTATYIKTTHHLQHRHFHGYSLHTLDSATEARQDVVVWRYSLQAYSHIRGIVPVER